MESLNQLGGPGGRKYRPEIDGLRAIAVLSVMFYHVGLGFGGGYVGVDIFFVISGFLITSLLLEEGHTRGAISVGKFWVRRIKRLLPALAVVMTTVWFAGLFLLLPADLMEMSQSMTWQSCLASNVFFWKQTGYFGRAAECKPLLHTWSLSVEEQFYLLFPPLLALTHRTKSLRWILWLGFGLSFALSLYTYKRMPSACFYLLPTRAWELLLGSILAKCRWLEPSKPRLKEAFSWLGLFLVLYPIFTYSKETPFPGLNALWPCLGAALIIASNRGQRTFWGERLAHNPFRLVGLMSYSLYLWHWPVISYINYYRLGPLGLGSKLIALLLMFILGWLSYHLVEKPFRATSRHDNKAPLLALAAVVWSFLLYGVACYGKGFPARYNEDVLRAVGATRQDRFTRDLNLNEAREDRFIPFGLETAKSVQLFVWGDSHAMSVMPGLDELCRARGIRGEAATHNSMPPILGASLSARFSQLAQANLEYNKLVFEYIVHADLKHVLLVGAWEDYFGRRPFRAQILDTVRALHANGKEVWILDEIPTHPLDVPHVYAIAKMRGVDVRQLMTAREEYLKYNSRSRSAFGELAGIARVLDPIEFFYPKGQPSCRLEADGHILYRDSDHLSLRGSRAIAPVFEGLMQAVTGVRQ